MKPDWGSPNVPEWAAFAAQEASGAWYWYSERPAYSEICTEWQTKGQRQIIPRVELRPQATLEARPKGPYILNLTPEEEAELVRKLKETLVWGPVVVDFP